MSLVSEPSPQASKADESGTQGLRGIFPLSDVCSGRAKLGPRPCGVVTPLVQRLLARDGRRPFQLLHFCMSRRSNGSGVIPWLPT